jgi:hypothetical protein
MAARLPKGWTGEEPVRPRASLLEKTLVPARGPASTGYGKACSSFFPLRINFSRTPADVILTTPAVA